MRRNRHTVLGLRALALTLATGALMVPAGIQVGASAAPGDGCARYSELQQVDEGMSRARVERILGTRRSRLADGAAGGYTRAYLSCNQKHEAFVEYGVRRPGATPRATGFTRWLRT